MYLLYSYIDDNNPVEITHHGLYKNGNEAIAEMKRILEKENTYGYKIETFDEEDEYSMQITNGHNWYHVFSVKPMVPK